MALRKAFPNERNYDFWNILLCFLVSQDDRASDKERLLFGTLAYRMVSKAAEAAPTNKVSGWCLALMVS
jgi:N-terminal acetyltransferase B complex non-catalytic subunit